MLIEDGKQDEGRQKEFEVIKKEKKHKSTENYEVVFATDILTLKEVPTGCSL